jgi:hypothetical protein
MQFITEQAEYDAVLAEVSSMIDITRHFPEQVFRTPPARFVITDFDLLWDADAWRALTRLAQYYGDSEILMTGNAPEADEWIRFGHGHRGAARMPVKEPGTAYRNLVWQEVGHPFHPEAQLLAMVSPSHAFAMWGELHANVAVFALYNRSGRPASRAPFLLRQFTMDETLAIMATQSGTGLPAGFAERMRREYGEPGQRPY